MKEVTVNNCHSYYDILTSFEYEILYFEGEDNYTGDSLVVFKNKDIYGFLIFGWGSCSGCDSFEACDTDEELRELQKELYEGIKWFDSLNDLKNYINSKDWDITHVNKHLVKTFREGVEKL